MKNKADLSFKNEADQALKDQLLAVKSEEDGEMVTMSYLLAKKYGIPLHNADQADHTSKDHPAALRSREGK